MSDLQYSWIVLFIVGAPGMEKTMPILYIMLCVLCLLNVALAEIIAYLKRKQERHSDAALKGGE